MGNTRARPRGLRHSTRYLFSRDFRRKGFVPLSTYMRTYKVLPSSPQQPSYPNTCSLWILFEHLSSS
jgi:hypothetical protein